MNNLERLAIEEVLRLELGRHAAFSEFHPGQETPMAILVDRVKSKIGDSFTVYRADPSYPEIFCLETPSRNFVIYSDRYLSVTSSLRKLFDPSNLQAPLVYSAEKAILKVVAEIALKKANTDFSVLTFVKSVIPDQLMVWEEQEEENLHIANFGNETEIEMATQLYGLAHELGHLAVNQARMVDNTSSPPKIYPLEYTIPDAYIMGLIKYAAFSLDISESDQEEILSIATDKTVNSVIAINHLRIEGLADRFACEEVFYVLGKVKKDAGEKDMDVLAFVYESIVFNKILNIIDFCHLVCTVAAQAAGDETEREFLYHSISFEVRNIMLLEHLQNLLVSFAYGAKPTEQQAQVINTHINEMRVFTERIYSEIMIGFQRARDLALTKNGMPGEWALLNILRSNLVESPYLHAEVKSICEMIDSLGKESHLLTVLKSIQNNPEKPADPFGELDYYFFWMEGPANFSSPLILDTKYGNLFFVFLTKGYLYDLYLGHAFDSFRNYPGYTLREYFHRTGNREKLWQEIADHLPQNRFEVLLEGTEDFKKYINMLIVGSLFE